MIDVCSRNYTRDKNKNSLKNEQITASSAFYEVKVDTWTTEAYLEPWQTLKVEFFQN